MQQIVNRKLSSIISSQQFCGLCLESTGCVWSTDVAFEIIIRGKVYRKCFKDIIGDIFHDVKYLPASKNICKQCTDKTLELYIFIRNIKETAKILDCYISCLYNKTVIIDEKLDPILYNNGDKKCTIILRSQYRNKHEVKNQKKTKVNPVNRIQNIAPIGDDYDDDDVTDDVTISTLLENESMKYKEITKDSRKNMCKADFDFDCNVLRDESLGKNNTKLGNKKDSDFLDKTETLTKNKIKIIRKNKIRRLNKVTKKVASKRKHAKIDNIDDNYEHECVESKELMFSCKEWEKHCQTKHIDKRDVDKTTKPRCEICLKNLSSNKYSDHKVYNKVKCEFCDTILEDSKLQDHLKANHKDLIPTRSESEKFDKYSNSLINKGIINSSNEKQYETCLKNFSDEQSKDYLCGLKCLCPESPCMHEKYLISYRDQIKKEDENIKCPDCDYTCNKKKDNFIDHANKEHLNHRPYICSVCAEEFLNSSDYTKHKTSHNAKTKYICKECNIEFDERKKLVWHNRKHKRAKQDKVKCTICSKEMYESTLNMHMKIHEGIESHSFTCETCGKSFAFKVRLDQHKMTHSDPVPCTLCGQLIKPMSMYLHLRRHKIRLNPALKPKPAKKLHNKKCEYCEYTTYCKDLLEIHVNKEHLKVKPHVCNVCGASYMSKYYLNQHMKVHTEEKKFNCPTCNKSLRHKIGLKKHMMLHTGEQPHICEVCGEGYKTVTMLKYHMQKHSGKNEQCPLCGGMYYSIKHVRSHIKKCHWEFKDRKFDYKQVRGLMKEHYHIFLDRRKAIADDIDDE